MTALKILFVNRMAGMERGGGETFDLEIARHLAELGCEVTVLTGRPVIRKPILGPREWWGGGAVEGLRLKVEGEEGVRCSVFGVRARGEENVSVKGGSASGRQNPKSKIDRSSASSLSTVCRLMSSVFFLRTPWLGWFPWDKVRGGWRIRTLDMLMFEWRAARWAWRNRDRFDIVQVCELPNVVDYFRALQKKAGEDSTRGPKLFMRLTGPYLSDPRKAVYKVDGLIASGATLEYVKRRKDWPPVYEIPNGVDLKNFGSRILDFGLEDGLKSVVAGERAAGCRLQVAGKEEGERRLETSSNVQRSTFNAQRSSGKTVEGSRFKVEGEEEGERLETGDQRLETSKETEDDRLKTVDLQEEERPDMRGLITKAGLDSENLQPSTCNLQPGITDTFRLKHKIPASAPVLLYVARFQAFKNHKLLIEAFEKVLRDEPEARLILVGSGPLMKGIKDLCGEMRIIYGEGGSRKMPDQSLLPRTPNPDLSGVARRAKTEPRPPDHPLPRRPNTEHRTLGPDISHRVIFLGETPFDQMPAIYAEADIAVISSTYESFCFVAIEAMAAGLPLVITDAGYVTRLIGDEMPLIVDHLRLGQEPDDRFPNNRPGWRIREAPGGLIAHRNDGESMARAMRRMIQDPGLRDRCGKWNREKALREHGWESSARKLLSVYEDLTADHAGDAG